MPSRFDLPHLDISTLAAEADYQSEGSGFGSSAVRIRDEHGRRMQSELRTALEAADQVRPTDGRLDPPSGGYVEVELRRGTPPDTLDRKRQGLRSSAAKADDTNRRTIALYVPDHARPVLDQILTEYLTGELTQVAQNPPNRDFVESIEAIRVARIATFWTDPKPIPDDAQTPMWWALWCHRDREQAIEDVCGRLELRAAGRDRRLYFPEIVVVPVLASRATIELMLFATDAIAELRRANDTPIFFTDDVRGDQHKWVESLAERTVWPGTETPAVCLLDTGINRGHALIEPALAPGDMYALDHAWGVDDHDDHGHGTSMAGMALSIKPPAGA